MDFPIFTKKEFFLLFIFPINKVWRLFHRFSLNKRKVCCIFRSEWRKKRIHGIFQSIFPEWFIFSSVRCVSTIFFLSFLPQFSYFPEILFTFFWIFLFPRFRKMRRKFLFIILFHTVSPIIFHYVFYRVGVAGFVIGVRAIREVCSKCRLIFIDWFISCLRVKEKNIIFNVYVRKFIIDYFINYQALDVASPLFSCLFFLIIFIWG